MMSSSQKVFDVLEYLCEHGPHRAAELSTALSLQKSSTHRFLNTLVEGGYVVKDAETGQFRPTLRVVRLGLMVSSRLDISERAQPHMKALVTEFGQTVSLGTLMGHNLLVLRREYPRHTLPHIDLSPQLPAYCTGIGKALLSLLDAESLENYIATEPRRAFTPHTLVDADTLRAVVQASAQRGYAEDRGEISESLHCVAVPMRSPTGAQQIWAMSVSGHKDAIAAITVPVLVERLREIADDLCGPPREMFI